MIAPALTLVLFNKKLRILPINVGRTNVQNPLDFVTALLVDRHKRGLLRHRGGYEDYKYLPVRFGAVVDSMASEATSKKLENNEKFENIEKKDDSKWLLTIKNENDFKNMINPSLYFFVLFEFEDINSLYNENIIASIWTVNPKNIGFYLCILDYYQNILSNSPSRAPFNLWPYMLKFHLMQPKLIYRSIISESEVTTTIFEDYLGGNVETLYPFVRFHKATILTKAILKDVIQKLCHKYNLYVEVNIDSYNKKELCEIIDEITLNYIVPNNTLCDILSESLYLENIDLEEAPDNYKFLLKKRGLY